MTTRAMTTATAIVNNQTPRAKRIENPRAKRKTMTMRAWIMIQLTNMRLMKMALRANTPRTAT